MSLREAVRPRILLLVLAACCLAAVTRSGGSPRAFDDSPKPTAEVQALIDIARKALRGSQPRPDEAEKQLTTASALAHSSGDAKGEAVALIELAALAARRGRTAVADGMYVHSAAISRDSKDPEGQGDALFGQSLLYRTDRPDRATELLQQAISLFRVAGNERKELHALVAAANVLDSAKQTEAARAAYDEVLHAARAIGDEHTEADGLRYLAVLNHRTNTAGDPALEAELTANLGKAIELYHKLDLSDDEAAVNQLLSTIWFDRGDLRLAGNYQERALALYLASDRPARAAELLAEKADFAAVRSDRLAALRLYRRAVDLYRNAGDDLKEVRALRRLAELYADLGRPGLAVDRLLQASRMKPESPHSAILAAKRLAELQDLAGDHLGAAATYRTAVRLLAARSVPANGPDEQCFSLSTLAEVRLGQHQPADAARLLDQEIALLRRTNHPERAGIALYQLGRIEQGLGDLAKARTHLIDALPSIVALGDHAREGDLLSALAEIDDTQHHLTDAESHLRRAIAAYDSARQANPFPGDQTTADPAPVGPIPACRHLVALLLRLHRPAEAFSVTQKLKARMLLEILAEGALRPGPSLSAEERSREAELVSRLDALNYRIVHDGATDELLTTTATSGGGAEVSTPARELHTFLEQLYSRRPEVARWRGAGTLELAEIGRALPTDTALLEYVDLGRYSHAALFVVTRRSGAPSLTAHTLAADEAELKKAVEALRLACSSPQRPYRAASAALYQLLLAPVERELSGIRRLVICPDGTLWNTPFAAIALREPAQGAPGSGRDLFLADRFEISCAPSATAAIVTSTGDSRPPPARPTSAMLAITDPAAGANRRTGAPTTEPSARTIAAPPRVDTPAGRELLLPAGLSAGPLPAAKIEADPITTAFPGAVVWSGSAAQEASVKQEAGAFQRLHFGARCILNDAAPLLSAIVLAELAKGSAEDGLLTAQEIFDLKLNADIAVLSACRPITPETSRGEGLIAISWALSSAGARTQVVSQWSVTDAASARWMKAFYASLAQKHLRPAEAIRRASAEVRTAPGHIAWAHPYYWAAFTALGDWK